MRSLDPRRQALEIYISSNERQRRGSRKKEMLGRLQKLLSRGIKLAKLLSANRGRGTRTFC